jgi:hypothetical protein
LDFDATLAQSLPAELPTFFRASSKAEENAGGPALLSAYRRTLGNAGQTVKDLLAELGTALPAENILGIRLSGSGGRLAAAELNATAENEFKAIACSIGLLYPDVRTVFEIGGESSKYLRLAEGGETPQATGPDARTYATQLLL